jgi:YggT family protein
MDLLITGIRLILNGYYFLIFAFLIMRWFPSARESRLYFFTGRLVEPYLSRFRSIIPPIGGIDLSPLLGFLLLSFAIRMLS